MTRCCSIYKNKGQIEKAKAEAELKETEEKVTQTV